MKRLHTLLVALFCVLFAGNALAADKTLATVISEGAHNATTSVGGFMVAADKLKLNTLTTATASTSAAGYMSAADKLKLDGLSSGTGPITSVRAVLSGVLPAYTGSGSMSAGTRVLTMNANGVIPPAAFYGVTIALNDLVLIAYNDNVNTEAGAFTVTAVGSGGAPAVLTQASGLNTASALQGRAFLVREGWESGLWVSKNPVITALGTDQLMWRRSGKPSWRHGWSAESAFSEGAGYIANYTTINQNQTRAVVEYNGFFAVAGNANATISGDGAFNTGNTAVGLGYFQTKAFDPSLARLDAEYSVEWSVDSVSDGTNAFGLKFGLYADASNYSVIDLIPTNGADIVHSTRVGGGSVTTQTLASAALAAGTYYKYFLRKPAFSTVWEIWFAVGSAAPTFIGNTPSLPTSASILTRIDKTFGTTVAKVLRLKSVSAGIWDPKASGV